MGAIERRTLLNKLLIGLSAFLLAAIIFEQHTRQTNSGQLTAIDKNAINSIIIQLNNKPDIRILKIQQHWQIQAPEVIPTHQTRIQNLLNLLNSHSYQQYDISAAELDQLHLDKPLARITFLGDDIRASIAFGNSNPVNHQRYALYQSKIHMLNDTHFPIISSGINSFASTRLLPEHNTITAIQLADINAQLIGEHWQSSTTYPDLSESNLKSWLKHWSQSQANYVKHIKIAQSSYSTKNKVVIQVDNLDTLQLFDTQSDHEYTLYNPAFNLQYYFDKAAFQKLLNPTFID